MRGLPDLGIETKDGTFTPVIRGDSRIPTKRSIVLTTVADNQTRAEVHVLAGHSDVAAHNRSLAKFELTNIPPAPKGVLQIEVMFEIDVNGVVSVEASAEGVRRQAMVIHPSGGLSQAGAHAAPTAGDLTELLLVDVTPHTLGVETKGGTFTPVIERNTQIPTLESRVITLVADERRVEVHILQGESDMAAHNKSLAKFELTGLPGEPGGARQVEITFEIDVNGVVSVEATDQATGRRQAMNIYALSFLQGPGRTALGLSQAEVDSLVSEARAVETGEWSKKDMETVVRQLDGLVANTMRFVQALRAKLSAEERERIFAAIKLANKARDARNPDEIKAALADMEKAATIIGQVMLRP